MALVEREINQRNFELQNNSPEFQRRKEIEHKLVPKNPELLETLYKAQAVPIEQLYLSTPEDDASLRLRAIYAPEGIKFSATQKGKGELQNGALSRTEIDTPISAEAYEFFSNQNLPSVVKFRASITEGVTVDFYDDPDFPVIVEVEHTDPIERAQLVEMMQQLTNGNLIDQSENPMLTNEALAFRAFEKQTGEKWGKHPETLDAFTQRVFREMVAHYAIGKNQVVVSLDGMSGSGKTTVTKALQEQAVELFGEAFRPIVISTDDYHFGKKALEETWGAPYSDWDAPRTYNTAELAADLERLAAGVPIMKRHFDFATEEPAFDEEVAPSPFVIVEGLYASSKDLNDVRDAYFELPTSIGTSIERDLRRLIIENRANRVFPNPESRLKYLIETALPLYISRERPPRRCFSASTRTMLGDRALMLAKARAIQ